MSRSSTVQFCFLIVLLGFPAVPVLQSPENRIEPNFTEKVLSYGTAFELDEFNYFTARSFMGNQWIAAVYNGLLERSPQSQEWQPELAVALPSVSEDGLTFNFTLRSDLFFDTGNALTVDDVIFSYNVALTSTINKVSYEMLSSYLTKSSVTKMSETTVRFDLTQKTGFALELFETPIIDQETWQDRYNDCVDHGISCSWDATDGADTVGQAGPFKFHSFDASNDILTLTKNPYYFDADHVDLDRLEFQRFIDEQRALDALGNGSIDILDFSHYVAVDDVDDMVNITTVAVTAHAMQEIGLNHMSPYWGTGASIPGNTESNATAAKLVRQAMSHIVDREGIVTDILGGLGAPASSSVPPTAYGAIDVPADQYNISYARHLMEQAGFNYSTIQDTYDSATDSYEKGFFNISILSPNTNPSRNQWSLDYAEQLPRIGINVTLFNSTKLEGFLDRTFWHGKQPPLYEDGGFDIMFFGLSSDLNWKPDNFYSAEGLCESGDCTNIYYYLNTTVEDKILSYELELDAEKKSSLLQEIQLLLAEELPVIPLIHPQFLWNYDQRIDGLDDILLNNALTNWEDLKVPSQKITVTDTTQQKVTTTEIRAVISTTVQTGDLIITSILMSAMVTMVLVRRKLTRDLN